MTPRFYTGASTYYSGLAYVNASVNAAVDGVIQVSYSFTGAGALGYT